MMAYAAARAMDADQIPVIDITPLRDGSDPAGVARALHAASTGLGFIYVTGHGIPETLIEAARAQAYRFFRADAAIDIEPLKRRVRKRRARTTAVITDFAAEQTLADSHHKGRLRPWRKISQGSQ